MFCFGFLHCLLEAKCILQGGLPYAQAGEALTANEVAENQQVQLFGMEV